MQWKYLMPALQTAAMLLIVAGLLEGFVSPIPWWTLGQKFAVAVLTAVLLGLFINLDRGRVSPSSPPRPPSPP